MEPSCLGFLRSLLCCQDEFDDTVHVDFTALKNSFKKKRTTLSDSESGHRTSLLRPTSVPRHNEATRDLDSDSTAAILHRARAMWLSSRSSSRPADASSSSPITQKSLIVSSSIDQRPAIIASSQSPITPKSAIVNSSSQIVQKPGIIVQKPEIVSSSSSRIALKPSIVNSSSLWIAQEPGIVSSSSSSLIASNPSIASSSSSSLPIALSPEIVRASSPVTATPRIGSYWVPVDQKPAIASSSSSSRLSQAEPEASSREKGLAKKSKHGRVDKNGVPLYLVPDHIKDLIKNNVLPGILKGPLSPDTYKEYFSVLLYAEDYYFEKWTDYELKDVSLEFHEAKRYIKSQRRKRVSEKDDRIFVEFKINSFPNKKEQPYLLSRDFVFARPSGSEIEPFRGIINCVVRSELIIVEFEDDFHSQHYPSRRYDISFSFNRVCLKRAHEALDSISDSLYKNFLFPNSVINTDTSFATVHEILSIKSHQVYLISGPKVASETKSSGLLVEETVFEIYRAEPNRCRVLICSPLNSSCDALMRGLKRRVSESEMFRANAAFRNKEDVPEDILSSSLYRDDEDCFACPQADKLRSYKIVFSTFVSTYRLHREGLPVGHFSHIFMVDSSTSIEPEALVPLANFAGENTIVVVTGHHQGSPNWVRSSIARENGLRVSYFNRLQRRSVCQRLAYETLDD